jgi:methyl-accepting chemotaxis protein
LPAKKKGRKGMEERFQTRQELKKKVLLLVGAALVSMGVILGATLLMDVEKGGQAKLRDRGVQVAHRVANKAGTTDTASYPLDEYLSDIGQDQEIAYLLVVSKGGEVLGEVNKETARAMLQEADFKPRADINEPTVVKKPYSAGNFFDVTVPIRSGGISRNEGGWVRLGVSLKGVDEAVDNLRKKMFLVLLVLTGVGVWAASVFARTVEAPLEKITEAAHRIGRGDLSVNVEQTAQQESSRLGIGEEFSRMVPGLRTLVQQANGMVLQVGSTTEALTQSMQKLREGVNHRYQLARETVASLASMKVTVQSVSENVEELSIKAQTTSPALLEMGAATVQVADSMTNLSSYVEDTASALLQMSSSIKQVVEHVNSLTDNMSETTGSCARMNTSISEIEGNAKESALLTEKVSKDADELGGGAVEKMIEGMENIKKAVEKSSNVIFKLGERTEYIGKILTVIDEVTRQTNLLALNAAILAAQAGEHGRGFAVVADEIKGLADRTATSTKEIAQLIRDLQAEAQDAVTSIREGSTSVEEGVRLSLDAKRSLSTILGEAGRSSSMSRQIEKSTVAQAQAIRMVTQSMDKMNQMVHQVNGAMQEQGRVIEHITEGSEKMRMITRQVKSATDEQASVSKQTSSAIEEIAAGVHEIGEGINLQKKATDIMTRHATEADQSTDMNKKLCDKVSLEMEDLVKNLQALKTEMGSFKI